MTQVNANGIKLEVETFGNPAHPSVLLIIGLSCQMIHWHVDLCRKLADQGYYVIRFDNRDTGLSTKLHNSGNPDIQQIVTTMMMGLKVDIPYGIKDMADDALGVLDALNIRKAHICGMSMGGMIAQTFAILYPERALSLTSIYSTTGDPASGLPRPDVMKIVFMRPPAEKNAFIQHTVETYRVLQGKGLPFDETFNTMMAIQAFERSYYPEGTGRQLAAILTQKNRENQLKKLTMPALVVHGTDDPLAQFPCGQETAAAIAGSKFVIMEGMGHELPTLSNPHWVKIFSELVEHFTAANKSEPI